MKYGISFFKISVAMASGLLPDISLGAECPLLPNNITNGTIADASQIMTNFNQLLDCINTGKLKINPAPVVSVISPQGNLTSIQNPSATSNYNFNLPADPGSAGQALFSGGGGSSQMYWASVPTVVSPPIVDGIPIGRPAASSFIWRNGGSATYAEYSNGPITLSIPAQNGDQIRGFETSIPVQPPYTATVKLDTLLWGRSYFTSAIYAADSGGKVLALVLGIDTGSPGLETILQVAKWNSVSSFNSVSISRPVSVSRVIWLRIKNDGTNWNFFVSHNGADWVSFFSEPITAFLGTNVSAIGVYGNNNDGSGVSRPSLISIWSFEIASGNGTNSHW